MNQQGQVPAILSLGTAVPDYWAKQENIAQWMAASLADRPATGRWLRQLYAHSGIETRHSCVPDFLEPPQYSRLAPGQAAAKTLTTAERMAIYQQESIPLGTRAGRPALASYAEVSNSPLAKVVDSVTHLIVVSCTGFFAPGLDPHLCHCEARRADAISFPPGLYYRYPPGQAKIAHDLVKSHPVEY